jgi:hypothetical protein
VLRAHLLFVVFLGAKLAFTMVAGRTGLAWVVALLAGLVVVVLVREIARLWTLRRLAGPAALPDEATLWPLGVLQSDDVVPRASARAALHVLAGQAVMATILGGVVWWVTGSWRPALPSPVDLGGVIARLGTAEGAQPWWLVAVWSLHAANLVVLSANALLPMLPLDAGRWVEARGGATTAGRVGLGCAAVLAALGVAVPGAAELIGIAAVGAAASVAAGRRVEVFDAIPAAPPVREPAAEQGPPTPAEVDRVLAKISAGGMASLTSDERRLLARATRDASTRVPGADA